MTKTLIIGGVIAAGISLASAALADPLLTHDQWAAPLAPEQHTSFGAYSAQDDRGNTVLGAPGGYGFVIGSANCSSTAIGNSAIVSGTGNFVTISQANHGAVTANCSIGGR